MSEFYIYYQFEEKSVEIDFQTFISIVDGSAIVSLADAGRFIEFGLSENMNMRVEGGIDTQRIVLFSTLGEDDVNPIRVRIIDDEELLTAQRIQQRINSLRQIYAIAFLFDRGREDEIVVALRDNPNFDLEDLLEEWERLGIEAAAPGSFWVTLISKVTDSGQAALNVISLNLCRGARSLHAACASHH